jgi:WD40 repeat protein
MAALLSIADDRDTSTKLVLAMRADFLDRFSRFPEFTEIIEKHVFVADMHPHELRQAIEQPAAHHGVVFEKGLVEEIIKDVQGQAGSLPLLQYTLDLLWQEEKCTGGLGDRHLNTTSYRELGGVPGALQKRADEIYASFADGADAKVANAKQEIVRQIFLRVVDITGEGADDRPIRRRAPKAIFTSPQEQEILQALIDQKLLVSSGRQGADATVEVAHEALFTSWERLKQWIAGGKQVIFAWNRLADLARGWHSRRKTDEAGAEDDLLIGSRLDEALDIRKRGDFVTLLGGLSETETQFLDASVALRERRTREKQERDQRELAQAKALATEQEKRADDQAKAAARQRWLTGAMVLGFLIALVAAGISIYQKNAALEVERQRAEQAARQNRINIAQRLAAQADNVLAEDPPLTLALAAEALQVTQRTGEPIVPAAEQSLRNAFARIGAGTLSGEKKGAKIAVLFTPDGRGLATIGDQHTAELWNWISKYPAPAFIDLPGLGNNQCGVAFSPDGRWLANATKSDITGPGIRLWALVGEDPTRTVVDLPHHQSLSVFDLAFSPDGRWLANAGGETGRAWLWDLTGGDPLELGVGPDPLAVAFSPDGHWLVIAGWNGSVRLWDLAGGTVAAVSVPLSAPPSDASLGEVRSVAFSFDSCWLAAAGEKGLVRVWDLTATNRTNAFVDLPHPGARAVAFSSNGRLASGGERGSIRLWDLKAAHPAATSVSLPGHKGDVAAVAFSPDGQQLATAGGNKTVQLWDLSASDPTVAFVVLDRHKGGPIYRIAFSRDGRWLATGSEDSTVRLWLVKREELIELAALVGRNLSPAEWERYFHGQNYRRIFPKLGVPPDPPEPSARLISGP